MYDLKRHLAVQSWCFRHFKSIPALIGQLQALGLTRVELCEVHAELKDPATHAPTLQQFRDAGIQIASIGVQKFKGDADEEEWFKFARAAGAKMIATTFELGAIPAVFEHAANLAEKYDILLGIHNHGGYDWLGNSTMVGHLLKHLHPRIGLCVDTAWCIQAGENPLHWVERFADKLFGIHLKDFTFDSAGKWTDVIVGTGNLDLPVFLAKALRAPNLTAVTLEYEGDVAKPLPKLLECLHAVHAAAT